MNNSSIVMGEVYYPYLTCIIGMKMLQENMEDGCSGIYVTLVCLNGGIKVQCISGIFLLVAR